MALPKNPNKYVLPISGSELTHSDLTKVTWHIIQGKYRTICKTTFSGFPLRKIVLPDKSSYAIFECYDIRNGKRCKIQCTVFEEQAYDQTMGILLGV